MEKIIPFEKSIFGKKARLDILARESINAVIDFAGFIDSGRGADEIEIAENNLIDNYYSMIYSMDKYLLPFWWEEFFLIEVELKLLVSQLLVFTKGILFINNHAPYSLLLKNEIMILEKVKKYFSDVIPGPESERIIFVEKITSDIKNFKKTLLEILNSQLDENGCSSMISGIFEKTDQINCRIIDSINRINLGAAV